ncbi:hypothetical protein ACOT1K_16880 [Providencia manganoxydans]
MLCRTVELALTVLEQINAEEIIKPMVVCVQRWEVKLSIQYKPMK